MLTFCSEKFIKNVFGRRKSNVGNRLKRVLAKFLADRSHPRGVNGRSKLSRFERRTSRLNAERRVLNVERLFKVSQKKFPWC